MENKLKQAIEDLKGKPIENFQEILKEGMILQNMLLDHILNDQKSGQTEDDELDLSIQLYEVMLAAMQYEQECRQEACSAASDQGAAKIKV